MNKYYVCEDCLSLIPEGSLMEGSCPDCGSSEVVEEEQE